MLDKRKSFIPIKCNGESKYPEDLFHGWYFGRCARFILHLSCCLCLEECTAYNVNSNVKQCTYMPVSFLLRTLFYYVILRSKQHIFLSKLLLIKCYTMRQDMMTINRFDKWILKSKSSWYRTSMDHTHTQINDMRNGWMRRK